MRAGGFRIENYRSIQDSQWRDLSLDGITALVGQNEAGKSSVLEALHAFETGKINSDAFRADGTLPRVCLSYAHDGSLAKYFEEFVINPKLARVLGRRINLVREWSDPENSTLAMEDKEIVEFIGELEALALKKAESASDESPVELPMSAEQYAEAFFNELPLISLFEEETSVLPATIDLSAIKDKIDDVPGYGAVQNFLTITSLDVAKLENANERVVKRQLKTANEAITNDFQRFWTQTVGKDSKISIRCDLQHYAANDSRAGQPYLAFWIADNDEELYPRQRSKGVLWFLSFYLQLRARANNDGNVAGIVLIDEPGASLHPAAQQNVLSVLEELKNRIQVIYTTHSPYMIDPEHNVHRILAVQRVDSQDSSSPTVILGPSELFKAAPDTLTPIFTAMGAPVAGNGVIAKSRNVLLEEISAYYYLRAFWLLAGARSKPHFLPARGVSRVEDLAYLLLGWGVRFIAVVDDDAHGRSVYNNLKESLYGGEVEGATKGLYKLPEQGGIENLFSAADFARYVLGDAELKIAQSNADYMKNKRKPLAALGFLMKVREQRINIAQFEESTQENIRSVVAAIEERIS